MEVLGCTMYYKVKSISHTHLQNLNVPQCEVIYICVSVQTQELLISLAYSLPKLT